MIAMHGGHASFIRAGSLSYVEARPWRRRNTFLPARQSFLENFFCGAGRKQQHHHRAFASSRFAHGRAPSRDWEMTQCTHTYCASPGHNVLDERSREETRLQETRLPTSRMTHMTKTKIALAAVLFAATTSAALAQGFFDPNLANRYPGYAEPNTYGYSASGKLGNVHSGPSATLQSAPVRLQQARQCAPAGRTGVATARCRAADGHGEFERLVRSRAVRSRVVPVRGRQLTNRPEPAFLPPPIHKEQPAAAPAVLFLLTRR